MNVTFPILFGIFCSISLTQRFHINKFDNICFSCLRYVLFHVYYILYQMLSLICKWSYASSKKFCNMHLARTHNSLFQEEYSQLYVKHEIGLISVWRRFPQHFFPSIMHLVWQIFMWKWFQGTFIHTKNYHQLEIWNSYFLLFHCCLVVLIIFRQLLVKRCIPKHPTIRNSCILSDIHKYELTISIHWSH